MRKIDRECGKMEREEKKVELEIKGLARKKEVSSIRILAKEVVAGVKCRKCGMGLLDSTDEEDAR